MDLLDLLLILVFLGLTMIAFRSFSRFLFQVLSSFLCLLLVFHFSGIRDNICILASNILEGLGLLYSVCRIHMFPNAKGHILLVFRIFLSNEVRILFGFLFPTEKFLAVLLLFFLLLFPLLENSVVVVSSFDFPMIFRFLEVDPIVVFLFLCPLQISL